MNIPKNKIDVSEWQTDKDGRRFRRIGNCIEYEPVIKIDGIEIPQSELAEYHQRRKEVERERKEAEQTRPEPPKTKNCPFSDGMQTACTRDKCALYVNGCAIPQLINTPARKDTIGLQCPLNKYHRACRTDCALYKNGCILTAIKSVFTEREV